MEEVIVQNRAMFFILFANVNILNYQDRNPVFNSYC